MRAFQISALVETAVRDEKERGIIRSKTLEDAARRLLEAVDRALLFAPLGDFDAVADTANDLRAALAEPVSKAQA